MAEQDCKRHVDGLGVLAADKRSGYASLHSAASGTVDDLSLRLSKWHQGLLDSLRSHTGAQHDVLARVSAEFERLQTVVISA